MMAACFNLATVEEVIREVHLGSRLETGVYQRETVEAEAEAIFLKIRDNLSAFFTPESFSRIVYDVTAHTRTEVGRPVEAVNLLVAATGIGEDSLESLLGHFMGSEFEPTVFELGQAVARHAQDTDDPARAEEVEGIAGDVLRGRYNAALREALV